MKTLIGIALAAVLFAGCGSTSATKTVTVQRANSTTASNGSATAPRACPKNIPPNQSGRCLNHGVTLVYAQRDDVLALKTLSVRIRSARVADQLASAAGPVLPRGRFVVVAIALTNTGDVPQSVDVGPSGQFAMVQRDRIFTTSSDAQLSDDRALASRLDPIQPGETAVGDLVFDVPPDSASVSKSGIFVLNFGEHFDASIDATSVREMGVLRLGGE